METTQTPRKRVNLTIPEALLQEAKEVDINLSHAATEGISAALKKAKEAAWLEENWGAIQAYNAHIDKHGTLLTPIWELRERGEI